MDKHVPSETIDRLNAISARLDLIVSATDSEVMREDASWLRYLADCLKVNDDGLDITVGDMADAARDVINAWGYLGPEIRGPEIRIQSIAVLRREMDLTVANLLSQVRAMKTGKCA